ncbi:MAG TPA: hypothetical protein VE961_24630 [Pyrinomonadaceae bacterium]|nr:hypothetical protein [Pyrinomonadaceae bacterium]
MQNSVTLNQQMFRRQHAERTRVLNNAAQRLVQRLLGCWQHELSRPFTHQGRTYRVCMNCGLSRDFNLETWKTQGASYTLRPEPTSANQGFYWNGLRDSELR